MNTLFLKRIECQLHKLWERGFYHIFGASFINKVIQFSASILLVRILSKQLYGVWTYAENILQFFLLLQGLGCVVGLLQFASANQDNPEKQYSYMKFTLIVGLIVNSIIALSIVIFYFFGELGIPESKPILLILAIFPVLNIIFDTIQMYFRSSFENKKFSLLTTVNSATFLTFSTLGALIWGIYGVAFGRYMAVIISVITGIYLLKPHIKKIYTSYKLSYIEIKEFLSFSLISMLSNIFSSLLFILDVFLIGLLMKDESLVATYKIATIIPFAMNFLPMTVLIYIYPYLVQAAKNKEQIKSLFKKLVLVLSSINAIISLSAIALAPFIIRLLFGADYENAIPSFRILMLGYFVIGSFRSPAGNTLNALKKVQYNLLIVIITGIFNIALDYLLIKKYGMIGAATTSLTVSIISAGLALIYFKKSV
ncbi:MAG TPA: oligosaccharide flippase family protein [Candidatus Cloacimonadota bacterium]|jgi:O-antigen/teichoic acid export membrane protein|nr:oligosaccharide flippase family protein [Candidatus Cloacimonadales bacterium]HPY97317.1 oligosaccharide flippase family protein [Candidatus Cloacimonadota bacterium]HQB41804.1 oligosaccharide flippase family protein [Candidatus Cloacimonadota bacterium]